MTDCTYCIVATTVTVRSIFFFFLLPHATSCTSVILIHTRHTESWARRICESFAAETLMLIGTDGTIMFLIAPPLIAFLRCQSGIFMSGDYRGLSNWQSQHLILSQDTAANPCLGMVCFNFAAIGCVSELDRMFWNGRFRRACQSLSALQTTWRCQRVRREKLKICSAVLYVCSLLFNLDKLPESTHLFTGTAWGEKGCTVHCHTAGH